MARLRLSSRADANAPRIIRCEAHFSCSPCQVRRQAIPKASARLLNYRKHFVLADPSVTPPHAETRSGPDRLATGHGWSATWPLPGGAGCRGEAQASVAVSAATVSMSNGIRLSRSWACRTSPTSRSVSKPVIAVPSSSTRISSWPRSRRPGCDALCRDLLPGGLQTRAAEPHTRLAQAARQRPRRSNRRAGYGMTLPGDMFGELT